jgi:hypothetical protein
MTAAEGRTDWKGTRAEVETSKDIIAAAPGRWHTLHQNGGLEVMMGETRASWSSRAASFLREGKSCAVLWKLKGQMGLVKESLPFYVF